MKKHPLWIAAVVVLFAALAGGGCRDDGPTSPVRAAVPTPTVTPIPAIANLAGTGAER